MTLAARACAALALAAPGVALGALPPPSAAARAAAPIVWTIDNLTQIGGHAVTAVGAPRVVDAPGGRAIAFDGARDGLIVEANPLAGLARFTVEVLFEPAIDGSEEQRFVHFEEAGSGNRALIELRLAAATWSLDTYLRHGEIGLTLLDRSIAHPAGGWHAAALTYDGKTMAHFVDRRRELQGDVAFRTLGAGKTSIGVRQNLVSFFKGRIRLIRVTPDVLAPAAMLEPPR
ncbi:MAG TPA: LamG-like jellyroll fold domain-containing protein [Vicinamibacterales bacterium]|nr:LamG-like jellyroll fold domain-containing protein [Vicinamibacterales bacterium]